MAARKHNETGAEGAVFPDLTVTVRSGAHVGLCLSIPIGRTVIDANLLSWVGDGLLEALVAAREGMGAEGYPEIDRRKRLEDLIEQALKVLDTLDGDADLEEDLEGDEGEDDAPGVIRGGSGA